PRVRVGSVYLRRGASSHRACTRGRMRTQVFSRRSPMKRTNLMILFLSLISLTGAASAQFNQTQPQTQAARREDRELVQRELHDRISRDERRDCEVQVERAETYFI